MGFKGMTDDELTALIEEAAKEVEQILAKAEGDEKEGSPEPKGEETPGEDSGSAPPADDASASPDASAAPAGPPADASAGPDASASPDAPPADASAAGPGGGDMHGELVQAYSGMDVEELKEHYLAAKEALFAKMQEASAMAGGAPGGPPGMDAGGAPAGGPPGMNASAPGPAASPSPGAPVGTAGAPPAPPAALGALGAPAESSQMPPPVSKAALNPAGKANGGQIMAKSEEMAALAKKAADLEESVKLVAGVLERITQVPQRKAFTGFDAVATAAETPAVDVRKLSKAEITSKLTRLAASPDLKKSDRQAINRFYDGRVGIEGIEHLLK